MPQSDLNIFHPLISKWFRETLGRPTDVQKKAWPEISLENNVLITAPTGSGKTLTAFLWATNQLLTGQWPGGHVRVLYISPLKALNNDIYKNLTKPLKELQSIFIDRGEPCTPVRVLTRSGDTPQKERRQMLRAPPEILITTPESLNILISSTYGRKILTGIHTVIMDEIHALAGSKRGTHLMTAVDRLVPLTGEFQRIALSATVKPLDKIADFIGGYKMVGDPSDPVYEKRRVSVIQSDNRKKIQITIKFPEDALKNLVDDSWWPVLTEEFKKIIYNNTSTLFFANSRRLTEKVARLINENEPEILAYSHHGSLAREIRLAVEQNLKKGRLKAIVATNSLELGIDIGELDQVVLIQSPFSISSAIQRIGRSGHSVGLTSKGIIFPTHGRDFLNAAVLSRLIQKQDIEELKIIEAPLDVLSQIILAMTAVEGWDIDELFAFIRTNASYHHLSRRQFDIVLDMLAGRFADTRLRELKPRISIDRIDNTVRAKKGVLLHVYMGGGTIPDRGYYDMRLEDSKSKIGELDEEFVWERRVGESFSLGNQTWRVQRITHNDLEVLPIKSAPGIIPFWKAETMNRDFHFSGNIGNFLEEANSRLSSDVDSLKQYLRTRCFMDGPSINELILFLTRQKEATAADLPHRHHLLIEHFDDPLNTSDSKQVILHALWGGRINRPFSMALSEAWENEYKYPLEVFADDDCILLMLPHRFQADDIFRLVSSENIEQLLRTRLEKTGFFGARFRENAGRALLLPKIGFKKRMPLWMNRLRSKKLMEAVMDANDFPILLETWRTCLRDEFDLDNLKMLLDELSSGHIHISRTITTTASPFSKNLIFRQTDKHMYEDDTPDHAKVSGLARELIREIQSHSGIFQGIPEDLIVTLERKLHRTQDGYTPSSPDDLIDWVKDRLIIPEHEFKILLQGIERDHGLNTEAVLKSVKHKLVKITFKNAQGPVVAAIEILPRIAHDFAVTKEESAIRPVAGNMTGKIKAGIDTSFKIFNSKRSGDEMEAQVTRLDFISQVLSFYGPVEETYLTRIFGFSKAAVIEIVRSLEDNDLLVKTAFRMDSEQIEICDRENFEILLRMARKEREPEFEPHHIDYLPLFLASHQGLCERGEAIEDLQGRLDQLFGHSAPASSWEEFILPARLAPYYPSWLDSLLQTSELCWYGTGHQSLSFAFKEDMDLFFERASKGHSDNEDIETMLPNKYGRYSFFDIAEFTGMTTDKASEKIWSLVWEGQLANDTFDVLRKGIQNKFKPLKAQRPPGKRKIRRGQFNRWKSSRPLSGNFYVPFIEKPDDFDLLEEEENRKERVRQLLQRYGLVFRELLVKEEPLFKWAKLFRTLRLMELSGEIISGLFFHGISGPQFTSYEGFRLLKKNIGEDSVFWMNATDPASLCGIIPKAANPPFPSRRATNYLVFHGKKLVLVAKKNGKEIEIFVPADHPHILRYFSLFKDLLNRQFNPLRSVYIETINDEKASFSKYEKHFIEFGFSKDYRGLVLRKQFT